MRFLIRDKEVMEERFPSAHEFILAASLRYEAFELACEIQSLEGSNRTEELTRDEKRLRELLQAPACRECWFVDILKHDFRNSVIVKKLLEKSLLALPDRTSSTY